MKKCERCAYWQKDGSKNMGDCRRRAPTVPPYIQGWPRVRWNDWCGEYKERDESNTRV